LGNLIIIRWNPEEIYSRTCGVCHQAGVANAPKTGDAAAWKARIDAKGAEAMLASVKDGLNAMPPKGMCMDCTDGEYQALIDFMAKGE
jgi:cytochrome c5